MLGCLGGWRAGGSTIVIYSLSYHSSCMVSPSRHLDDDEDGDGNGFSVLSWLCRKKVKGCFFLFISNAL